MTEPQPNGQRLWEVRTSAHYTWHDLIPAATATEAIAKLHQRAAAGFPPTQVSDEHNIAASFNGIFRFGPAPENYT